MPQYLRPDSTSYPPSAPQGHHDGPQGYNGWANYETWNVALWLTNDQCLYGAMTQFARYRYSGTSQYRLLRNELRLGAFKFTRTPDGVDLNAPRLDIEALDEVVRTSGYTPLGDRILIDGQETKNRNNQYT